jgi:hypothetical protein
LKTAFLHSIELEVGEVRLQKMASRGKNNIGLTSDGSDYDHRMKVEPYYEKAGKAKKALGASVAVVGANVAVGLGMLLLGFAFAVDQAGDFAGMSAPLLQGLVQHGLQFVSVTKNNTVRDNKLKVLQGALALWAATLLWGVLTLFWSYSGDDLDSTLVLVKLGTISFTIAGHVYHGYWSFQLLSAWSDPAAANPTGRKKSR